MGLLADFEAKLMVDEKWVVTQINSAWLNVQNAEKWVDKELTTIASWLESHHSQLLTLFQGVLALVPAATPEISAAVVALDAGTAAIDALARGLKAGTTPISTVSNAYAATKNAVSAVNVVLKQATAQPKA